MIIIVVNKVRYYMLSCLACNLVLWACIYVQTYQCEVVICIGLDSPAE